MLRDTLQALVGPVVEGLGYELWELDYAPGRGNGCLRLYIDAAAGITLEDCERVSRAVSELLDREDPVPGHYTLEVSSPGLDRPLFQAQDFERFAGQQIKVCMRFPVAGQRNFRGCLRGLHEQQVVIEEQDGTRVSLPLDQVEQARLVPDI